MNNPLSFGDKLLFYLNIKELSENTQQYIVKLSIAFMAWIGKNITQKPTVYHLCNVLETLLSLGVATPYISRVRDIATKFDEYYVNRNKYTEIFERENRLDGVDITTIMYKYCNYESLDFSQYLIVIIEEILDNIRNLLSEKPYSSNEEIINYVLENVPNNEIIISNIDLITSPLPVYITENKNLP